MIKSESTSASTPFRLQAASSKRFATTAMPSSAASWRLLQRSSDCWSAPSFASVRMVTGGMTREAKSAPVRFSSTPNGTVRPPSPSTNDAVRARSQSSFKASSGVIQTGFTPSISV